MEERVHFAVGAASMILAACCLVGALLTAWLRCAARAMTQAAGWAVVQQLAGGRCAVPGSIGGGAGQHAGRRGTAG